MVRDVLVLFGMRARNFKWERGKYQMIEPLGCHSCFKSQCASWRVHVSERLFTSPCHQKVSAGPQKQVCEVVLQHFDQQYSQELGQLWVVAREVLLQPHQWQYGIMLNRFCAPENLRQRLCLQGFSSLIDHGSLQCLVHPACTRFPSQKHQPGWLKQYYLLNAASLLPVLALDVREGDRLLDMCSAPGGKALAVLQCVTPALLHCNELNFQRQQWLSKTLESYVPPAVRNILTVSNLDGRTFGELQADTFDKVLVDAPCSNDRSWLFSAHPQQSALRLGERTRLPEIQRHLLSGLRTDGSVVAVFMVLEEVEVLAGSVSSTVDIRLPGLPPAVVRERFSASLSLFPHMLPLVSAPELLAFIGLPARRPPARRGPGAFQRLSQPFLSYAALGFRSGAPRFHAAHKFQQLLSRLFSMEAAEPPSHSCVYKGCLAGRGPWFIWHVGCTALHHPGLDRPASRTSINYLHTPKSLSNFPSQWLQPVKFPASMRADQTKMMYWNCLEVVPKN